MEGWRATATLRARRCGAALPTRYYSRVPGCLQRSPAASEATCSPDTGLYGPSCRAGDALPAVMPCAEDGYSCAHLRGSCVATAKRHLGCRAPPDPPLYMATARLHLQNKSAWKYWMQGLDRGGGLPAWTQPRLLTCPAKYNRWLLPARSTKPQPRPLCSARIPATALGAEQDAPVPSDGPACTAVLFSSEKRSRGSHFKKLNVFRIPKPTPIPFIFFIFSHLL